MYVNVTYAHKYKSVQVCIINWRGGVDSSCTPPVRFDPLNLITTALAEVLRFCPRANIEKVAKKVARPRGCAKFEPSPVSHKSNFNINEIN